MRGVSLEPTENAARRLAGRKHQSTPLGTSDLTDC